MNGFRLWTAFVLGWWLGLSQAPPSHMPAIVPASAERPLSPAEFAGAGNGRSARRRRAKLEREA